MCNEMRGRLIINCFREYFPDGNWKNRAFTAEGYADGKLVYADAWDNTLDDIPPGAGITHPHDAIHQAFELPEWPPEPPKKESFWSRILRYLARTD